MSEETKKPYYQRISEDKRPGYDQGWRDCCVAHKIPYTGISMVKTDVFVVSVDLSPDAVEDLCRKNNIDILSRELVKSFKEAYVKVYGKKIKTTEGKIK